MKCGRVIWVVLIVASLLIKKANAQQYAFLVTFTDKNNTPYSLSSPGAYLSPRALARRATQGIAIDSTDLPVNPAYVDSVVNLTGGLFYETSRWLNTCVILLQDTDSLRILNLAGKPFISNVELVGTYCSNLFLRKSNNTTPPSPIASQRTTTADDIYYGSAWNQTAIVKGNYLHDNGYNGEGMLIAVLDAGFIGADTHPYLDSLWASGRVVDTFDFTFHNTNVFNQDTHGMVCLSLMAGYRPDTFVGTAPLAMYALYLTENNGDDQPANMCNMIAGAERADSIGADVITESLGYDLLASSCPPGQTWPENFSTMDGKTTIAAKSANIATTKGMLFVATAGNDGTFVPGYGNHILTPGDADSALTIGAVDETGTIANFSGYGPNAAGQVKPDVCAVGLNEVYCFPNPPPLLSSSASGTSFSTPQVAGWAACLWEANPTATPYQIRQAIIRCASSYSAPGAQLGYGIPNFACTAVLLNVKDTPPPFTPANWIIAAPNPFNNGIKLFVAPDANGYVDFELADMAGRKVTTLHQYFYRGYNTPVLLATPDLPVGIYILKAVSSTQQQVIKLEKH